MGRLFGLVLGIFLISCQTQHSAAFDVIGIASGAIKFGKSIYDVTNSYFNKDTRIEDLTTSIQNMNQDIQDHMIHIIDTLRDLPSIIRLELNKETLEGHFALIGQVFEEASRMKKEIDEGIIDRNNSKYQRFATKEKDIDHSIYEIRRILTDSNTTFVLKQNFTETSKKFDNVCKTGMSHLQLLDSILGNLKAATVQYYLSKKFMYEFLELIGEDNTKAKETLLKNVNLDYSNAVRKFKDIMSTASLELWACDPSDGYNDEIRYINETGIIYSNENYTFNSNFADSNFAELRMFSKYILNENNYVPELDQCIDKKCSAITNLTSCGKNDLHFCNKVRTCPGKLIGCQQYTRVYKSIGVDVCKNSDEKAYHRYLSIVPKSAPAENFECEDGNKHTLYSISYGYPHITSSCDYCDCICEEDEYYVEYLFVQSDIDSNKVITGAKLVIEDKTLRLQIQQAKLMANGIIDKATLEWKPLRPIEKSSRVKISYNEYKKFALTPVINSDGGAVCILGLSTNPANKMIYMYVGFIGFNFETGVLNPEYADIVSREGKEPSQQYNMTKRDMSTKSKEENNPDSTEDQYVELGITDLAKDGGQSVIPFIDTRSVTANGPLSGASLYIRGQPGFGGFLAIKLYTFDIRKYVDDQSEV